MSVDLVCVDPKEVEQVWQYAGGLIRTAIERTGLSDFAGIEKQVLAGEQFLWLAVSDHIEAAATTHLIKDGARPVLVITACAGAQRERWLPLLAKIEHYARAENARCVRLYGRKGWQRALKDYRTEFVIMERQL